MASWIFGYDNPSDHGRLWPEMEQLIICAQDPSTSVIEMLGQFADL
jgi:hypothetical protein